MNLLTTEPARIVVALDAEDCLLLARACALAADNADGNSLAAPNANRYEDALYRALAFAFEGYATLGQAQSLMRPRDYHKLEPARVRQDWGLDRGQRDAHSSE